MSIFTWILRGRFSNEHDAIVVEKVGRLSIESFQSLKFYYLSFFASYLFVWAGLVMLFFFLSGVVILSLGVYQ